jgi:putative copper resistance protein D
MDEAAIVGLRTAASAVFDIGLATMVGALATLALLRDASSDWGVRGALRCRALFLRASLLTLAASLAWMGAESVAMLDLPVVDALQGVGGLVADTAFGQAWAAKTIALAACAVLAYLKRYRPMPWRWLGVGVVVVAAEHANTGHAGANGLDWRLPAMALHLLAMGAWAGSVFAAVRAVLRGVPHDIDGARYASRLSRLATAALGTVAVTGGATAWHGLGGSLVPLAPATASAWGVALDAKLVLVAAAVALGGFNRFFVLPWLPDAGRRFAWVLRVEAGVLAAALVAAAILANGEPPAL